MIEVLFHGLIMKRNGCEGNPTRLTDKGFVFPSLKDHVTKHGENGKSSEWYAVPGMYGGFNTRVAKDPECETWKLSCESWCRVCEGSEESHEITLQDGVKLIQ